MPCHIVKVGNTVTFVKTAPAKARRCSNCGTSTRDIVLCDFVIEAAPLLFGQDRKPAKTCDAALCRRCAVHRSPDTDYCPQHAPRR
jgi:hypothetical protein